MNRFWLLPALVLALLPLGCLGQPPPQKQRYVLEVNPAEVVDPGSRGVVQLNRVRVAALFERKGLVYRTGDDRYEADFYHEFYAPPGEMVREALSQWLQRSGVFFEVVSPTMHVDPDWWLEGRVTKLYADMRRPEAPEAVLETHWTLLDAGSADLAVVFEGSYGAVVALKDREPATVVDGIRRALIQSFERLDEDMARALDERAANVAEDVTR